MYFIFMKMFNKVMMQLKDMCSINVIYLKILMEFQPFNYLLHITWKIFYSSGSYETNAFYKSMNRNCKYERPTTDSIYRSVNMNKCY